MEEDGFFETFGALCFLVAAILVFVMFFRVKSGNDFFFLKTSRNIFFVILGILFIFGFGEEISWGQRIFGLSTPAVIESANTQGEMNIHNLSIFRAISMNRLFSFFWFTYCVLLPLASHGSKRVVKLTQRINLPTLPLNIGLLFLVNYLVSRIIALYVPLDVFHSLIEFKEFNFGVLFLIATIYFTRTPQWDRCRQGCGTNYEHSRC
jgi:hypothetical protein